jgi:putative ABC transport system permease protein
MGLLQTLRLALLDLSLHKFRSALAALGIIFGVASVVAMISISEGARQAELARYAAMGVDNIILRSIRPSAAEFEKAGQDARSYGLLRRDLAHVRNTFSGVRYLVGLRNIRKKLYSRTGKSLDLTVLATDPDFLRIVRASMQGARSPRPDGRRHRFITDTDNTGRKRVCVLGANAARSLFAYRDPLKQVVRIEGDPYRCIGVIEPIGTVMGGWQFDVDNCVIIPLQTGDIYGSAAWGASVQLDAIGMQMEFEEYVPDTADRLVNYLGKRHKTTDYEIYVPLALLQQKEETQNTWALVMGIIAGISLLVGGIGIMNIMLSNVSDRRKEIGTRRALGARRRDILRQFVIEAAVLTGLGGLMGVVVGYAIAAGITYFVEWPTEVPRWAIGLSVSVSCLTGLIFGYWPARQAARVRPIEALRSD